MHDDAIEKYLASLEARGLSATTIKAARADLGQLRRWWEKKRQRAFATDQLIDRDLRQWQSDRQQLDGVSPSTINRNLSSIRGFCVWATERGLMPENPVTAISAIPTDPLSPRSLPDEAIDALLRAAYAILSAASSSPTQCAS